MLGQILSYMPSAPQPTSPPRRTAIWGMVALAAAEPPQCLKRLSCGEPACNFLLYRHLHSGKPQVGQDLAPKRVRALSKNARKEDILGRETHSTAFQSVNTIGERRFDGMINFRVSSLDHSILTEQRQGTWPFLAQIVRNIE
jgi:hypothetical protein